MSSHHHHSEYPAEFRVAIEEFVADLRDTFPEFHFCLPPSPLPSDADCQRMFEYCLALYPPRFFDIINKNAEIFLHDSDVNTFFLPGCEFKALYHCEGVSESTRENIWKYLQLILFRIVGSLENIASFGECLRMFDNIDSDELREKMKHVMENLASIVHHGSGDAAANPAAAAVDNDNDNDDDDESDEEESSEPTAAAAGAKGLFTRGDAENTYSKLQGLLNGSIGSLAKELAADISRDIQEDIIGGGGSSDGTASLDATALLQNMFSNVDKVSSIVHGVSDKLQAKMQSGEINQEALLREATDILGQMNNIPGMGNMKQFMKTFGKMMGGSEMGDAMAAALGGLGGGVGGSGAGNPDSMSESTRQMREKMRARLQAKRRAQQDVLTAALAASSSAAAAAANTNEELTPIEKMMALEEQQQQQQQQKQQSNTNAKKSKNKEKSKRR